MKNECTLLSKFTFRKKNPLTEIQFYIILIFKEAAASEREGR